MKSIRSGVPTAAAERGAACRAQTNVATVARRAANVALTAAVSLSLLVPGEASWPRLHPKDTTRRFACRTGIVKRCSTTLSLRATVAGSSARLEAVDRPELLPKTPTSVIDVPNFLAPSEVGVNCGASCTHNNCRALV
jgi:hypothetical protein